MEANTFPILVLLFFSQVGGNVATGEDQSCMIERMGSQLAKLENALANIGDTIKGAVWNALHERHGSFSEQT